MAFDPEKVERFEPDSMMTQRDADARFQYRQYVKASDYDQLLKLYREKSELVRLKDELFTQQDINEAYANGRMKGIEEWT